MPFPQRYNPVAVQIRPLDLVGTDIDDDFRNTDFKRSLETITVDAQPAFEHRPILRKFRVNPLGDEKSVSIDASLVFTKQGLADASYNPKIGDVVIKVAGQDVNFKIVEVIPAAPLKGVFNLFIAYLDTNSDDRQVI